MKTVIATTTLVLALLPLAGNAMPMCGGLCPPPKVQVTLHDLDITRTPLGTDPPPGFSKPQ